MTRLMNNRMFSHFVRTEGGDFISLISSLVAGTLGIAGAWGIPGMGGSFRPPNPALIMVAWMRA